MNITPATYPLTIERGTKTTYAFIFTESATGPVVNLTGTIFTGQIRRSFADNTSLMIPLTFVITDAAAGAFQFTLDDREFDLIPPEISAGVYDVLWEKPSVGKSKVLTGAVTIKATATRPS